MHHQETPAQKIGYTLAGIGIVIPSMILSGFLPGAEMLPLAAWLAICGGAGAVGTAIAQPPRIASFVAGAIGGACIPLAMIAYVELRIQLSDTFFTLEFIIPGLVGAVPGIIAFKVLAPFFTPDEDRFGA